MLVDYVKSSTALLVLDVQRGAVSYVGEDSELLKSLSNAVATARKAGIRVIHAMVHFREGYPEISPRNRAFSKALATGALQAADMSIHSAVAPQPGEVIVTKERSSAFTGSDLEVVLRAQGINRLVLCGITTGNVVLSTLLEAEDKDYELIVLSDCCADTEQDVQHVLMTKIFPRCAEVITADDWDKRVSETNS